MTNNTPGAQPPRQAADGIQPQTRRSMRLNRESLLGDAIDHAARIHQENTGQNPSGHAAPPEYAVPEQTDPGQQPWDQSAVGQVTATDPVAGETAAPVYEQPIPQVFSQPLTPEPVAPGYEQPAHEEAAPVPPAAPIYQEGATPAQVESEPFERVYEFFSPHETIRSSATIESEPVVIPSPVDASYKPVKPVYEQPVYEETVPAMEPEPVVYEQATSEQVMFEAAMPVEPVYEEQIAPTAQEVTYEAPVYEQPATPVYQDPAVQMESRQVELEPVVYEQAVPEQVMPEQPVYEETVPAMEPEPVVYEQATSEQVMFEAATPVEPVYEEQPAPTAQEVTYEAPVYEEPATPVYEEYTPETHTPETTAPEMLATEVSAPEVTVSVEQDDSVENAEPAASDNSVAPTPVVPAGKSGGSDKKRRRRRRRFFAWFIPLLIILLIAGGFYGFTYTKYGEALLIKIGLVEDDYSGENIGEKVKVFIHSGDGGEQIAATLVKAGVIKTEKAFLRAAREQDTEQVFQPGGYILWQNMSAADALASIQDPESRIPLRVLLREGLTLQQSLKIISENVDITLEDLQKAAKLPVREYGIPENMPSLEGWLFPATYELPVDADAKQILQLLVNTQIQALDSLGVPVEDREKILTIASIIQAEAGTTEDFPKIARVIYNRLDQDMKLQLDTTAQYGYGENTNGDVWSSSEALENDNPYNTYKHKGLPVGPISNPGKQAIEAALHPAEGKWLYFVPEELETGKSHFSITHEEHEQAVEKFKQWCRDTPNSGC